MSVLTCPVCQSAMKEVTHNGVLVDTCTRCRGVWLDRGELEKLAAIVSHGDSSDDERNFLARAPSSAPPMAPSVTRHRNRDDDDDDDRRSYGRKSRTRSFLDFFD